MREYDVSNIEMLPSITLELLRLADNCIFAIYGEMGVGKTTLINSFCQNLNVVDSVSSPTFPIVNEYSTIDGDSVFHFDFYRIDNIQDLDSIGLDTYFNSGYYCFIEWPSIIQSELNVDFHSIKLRKYKNHRKLIFLQ